MPAGWFDPLAWAEQLTGSGGASFDALINQDVYLPVHTAIENWITSPLGMQVDSVINTLAGQY